MQNGTVFKKFLDTLYLLCSIGGALLVASNTGYQLEGYILFFIASVTGCFLLLKSDASKSLFWVSLMYAVINVIGIVRA